MDCKQMTDAVETQCGLMSPSIGLILRQVDCLFSCFTNILVSLFLAIFILPRYAVILASVG